VPRRILAHPQNGVPGTFDEPNGQRLQGVYKVVAYVYGPGEAVPAGRTTLRELRALHGDPAQQSLVVPFTGDTTFTFGPDLLNQIDDTDIVQIEFSSPGGGPKPEVCSCGKLSVRHAVSYHDSDAERAAGTS
jgi:hypothetical protein